MRCKRSGSAFVLAVGTILVLSIVVAAFSVRLESHIRAESNRIGRIKAEQAVQAGIARAMATLTSANLNALDTTEEWATIGNAGAEGFQIGDASVRIQIVDATRFVDINSATEEQLVKMNLTDEQAACLLDWREDQIQPRALGAKDEFYNALETPYNAKLRRFESVNEIFLVKGFTPELVLLPPQNVTSNLLASGSAEDQPSLADLIQVDSQSPNTRADGSQRVNLNVAQNQQLVQAGIRNQAAQAIIQRRNTQGQFTSFNQVFNVAGINAQDAETLLNVATVTNETTLNGKININTASEQVLRTIPNLTEQEVAGIVQRSGQFRSLGELVSNAGLNTNTLGQVADFFAIGSSSFLVYAEGRSGPTKVYWIAHITVENGQPRVTKMERPLQRNPLAKWGWDDDASTTTTLIQPAE